MNLIRFLPILQAPTGWTVVFIENYIRISIYRTASMSAARSFCTLLSLLDEWTMTSPAACPDMLVLRFLNGRFAGEAFPFERSGCGFRVGRACTVPPPGAHALRMINVPGGWPETLFSIEPPGREDAADFMLVHATRHGLVRTCACFQQPCRVGRVRFVVTPQGEPWMPAFERRAGRWRRARGLLPCLLMLGALGWALTQGDPPGEWPVRRLREALAAPLALNATIVPGRDGAAYVFAADETEASWARYTLARTGTEVIWHVLTLAQEKTQIEAWLTRSQPGLLTLRLDDVRHPVLVLETERFQGGASALAGLRAGLLGNMPYARSVSVEWHRRDCLLREARAGLEALSMVYAERPERQGTVFVLKAPQDASSEDHLRAFLTHFDHTYGSRRVRFVVESGKDWLEGRPVADLAPARAD